MGIVSRTLTWHSSSSLQMSKDRQKKMSYCSRETDLQYKLSQRQRPSRSECYYTSVTNRQGTEHRQEVNCLTQNKEQLVVYLPPYLPHNLAVRAVEDILDMKYNQLDNKSQNLTLRKTSAVASPIRHVADVHRKTSLQGNQNAESRTGESPYDGGGESQCDSGVFSEPGQNFLLSKNSKDQDISASISSTSVLGRLDTLDRKISEQFSNQTKERCPVAGARDDGKDSQEENELKQLLLKKLSLFRNKKV